MATSQKRELYDAAEYADKMKVMIANLRKQTPGSPAGKVGKNEVLAAERAELKKLLDDGFTVKQIVEAMKQDVFSVLPKTITEIVNNKNKIARATGKKTGKATRTATIVEANKSPENSTIGEKAADKSTFKPRKMDLDNL